MSAPTFPLIGFSRHRMGTDGRGVTTLAAAWGCPLRCRYCLNPQSWRDDAHVRTVTPEELYAMARVDDLYFRATGGGVTFGGGEPLLRAPFLRAFRDLCGDGWRITAETCLNVPEENLRIAMDCIDEFVVDIKDMDSGIYRAYTGADNAPALRNLAILLADIGPGRVLVRVPHIPHFNTDGDVGRSLEALRAMGATRFDEFTYLERKPQ